MAEVKSPVSDILVTAKSREILRGMYAEMRGNRVEAEKHLLAGAHLELVLADDYLQAGKDDLAFRSRLSAASCFWRAGHKDRAQPVLAALIRDFPTKAEIINESIAELEQMAVTAPRRPRKQPTRKAQ